MSEFENSFSKLVANFLNQNFISPVAKHVVENIDSIKDKTVEELTEEIRSLLDVPQTTISTVPAVKSSQNIFSMAPSNNGVMPSLAGLGTITPTEKTTKKRTKKEVPQQVWMTIESYQEAIDNGLKICAFYSSRSTDPTKSNKVCGAVAFEDTENPLSDNAYKRRCVQCKDKKSDIEKLISKTKAVNGIDPTKAIPGFNVLPSSLPPKAAAPIPEVPVPSGLFGTSSVLPPVVPTMGVSSPVAAPVSPVKPPAPIELPPPVPVKAASPKPLQLALDRHKGLKAGSYKAKNPDLANVVFKVDTSGPAPTAVAIGKFMGLSSGNDAPENYEDQLVELTKDEEETLSLYKVKYKYQRPEPPVPVLSIPGISLPPGIPGLPSIEGIPGLN
jgi:hypothetical protein